MKRFYIATAVVFLTALGGSLIIAPDPTVQIGIAAGYALGVIPVAGWHLIAWVTAGFTRRDQIPAAVGIGVGKLALMGSGSYLLFANDLVNLVGFLVGSAAILPVLVVMALAGQRRLR